VARLAAPLRGQVFYADLDDTGGHYWVVVSNNARNNHASDVLATMITSSAPRSPRPSYVPLAKGLDPFDGWVKCDRIGPINQDELGPVKGGISRPTMRLVDIGLAFALGLSRPA
jgi:mRNA-degrading endonuclease toxin of MazEF toxin-antitoxin module